MAREQCVFTPRQQGRDSLVEDVSVFITCPIRFEKGSSVVKVGGKFCFVCVPNIFSDF